jgi:formate C-acetyltransferase
MSYLIVETYREMDIYSPKIHIRVSDKTPADFVKKVLECIRNGQSSFVLCNDNTAIKSLMSVGIKESDARDYVPIGCYEPAVWGKEIGCTGNGGVNLPKAVEFVLSGGIDVATGKMIGVKPSVSLDTFEGFLLAVKEQISFMTGKCLDYVRSIEKYYDKIGPDTLHSAMYDDSVKQGVDVFEGGAKYNNSSLYFYSIASLVDSLMAVKKFVYDEKILTLSELFEILKNDWIGSEGLLKKAKKMPENATRMCVFAFFLRLSCPFLTDAFS